MNKTRERRVVVTGMGVISPIGLDVDTFWKSACAGTSGIGMLENSDADDLEIKVAAHVRGYDPLQTLERKEARRMDRYCQFALTATAQAMAQSGLNIAACGPWRVGTIIGSGVGGLETISAEFKKLYLGGGPSRISPLFVPMMIANMAAGRVAMQYQAKGTSLCITTACASGTHAIGEAFRQIKHGYLDACIAGGAEAPITPIAISGFANMMALSKTADPTMASLPFDARRSGFVIAEGAGIVVLEERQQAIDRGAEILAEIAGYGSTADAYHITSPDPNGAGPAEAMRLAIEEAGLQPQDIDYINAHGTGTSLNDKYETLAIKKTFGNHANQLRISSIKSMTGHLLGAAGAVEAVACVLALRDGIIPPTIGLDQPDPECDLDYTPNQAEKAPLRAVLSNSLGFGGHNGTLCFCRGDG